MQRRPLRDELRDAFEAMSEPAHPALASRIHEEIRSQPAPGAGMPRLAAVIAALVAVVVVAGLVLIGRHALPSQGVPAGHGGLPSPAATAPASPPPGSPAPGVAASPGAASPAQSEANPIEIIQRPFCSPSKIPQEGTIWGVCYSRRFSWDRRLDGLCNL